MKQPTIQALASILALEAVKGFGPQKFKAVSDAGLSPAQVMAEPSLLPTKGKRADDLRLAIAQITQSELAEAQQRAERQLERASEYGAQIIVYGDPHYPANVFASNNPVPVIYARGNLEVLDNRRVVACVGSRKIAPPYSQLHERFAATAASRGFAIASGFAMGADSIGHRAAWKARGQTICVMPNGLDRPFPPENSGLWTSLLAYDGAAIISEFPFGRGADSLTLRKRNKLIVGAALGVLVSQSARSGGAMNAFRFAVEQRKPIATFAPVAGADATGNALIRDDPKVDSSVLGNDEGSWWRWLDRLSS